MNGNRFFWAILKRFRGKNCGVSVEKVKRGQYYENFLEFLIELNLTVLFNQVLRLLIRKSHK